MPLAHWPLTMPVGDHSDRHGGLSIIDSHAHLCDPRRFAYRWASRDPHDLRYADSAAFFVAVGDAPVESLVFVEAAAVSDQIQEEIVFATEQATLDTRVCGFVASLTFESGENVQGQLERLSVTPLVRGIRLLSRYAADPMFFLKPESTKLIDQLPELNLICEIGVWPDELPRVGQLASRCQGTQFVLNHAGKPDIARSAFQPWARDLAELGRCSNVSCKISGLATLAGSRGATGEVLAPYIAHVFDVFGPERTLFGSDWPMMETALTYPEWVNIVRDGLPTRSPSEELSVFRDNAIELYGLHQKW